jgi:hypothetical protein
MLTPMASPTREGLEEFATWFAAWIPAMLNAIKESAAHA